MTGAANVIGSALLVSGVLSRLIYALSGYGWPRLGSAALVAEQPVRWLVRRQIDHRGNLAAAGRPIAATVPVMPEGKDRRRRSHQALATYATERRTDRAAGPRLHRYPMNAADIGPTRIAVTLAAMSERIRRRHGLDIAACWELLPGDARDRLARESAQVAVRSRACLDRPLPRAVGGGVLGGWPAGAAADAVQRAGRSGRELLRPDRGDGGDPPAAALHRSGSPAARLNGSRDRCWRVRVSAYLAGIQPTDLPLCWPSDAATSQTGVNERQSAHG